MERHANKTNAPEMIKVPLQMLSKSGKTVFAYLRRSTKKEEQKDSKQKQNDSIDLMATDIGINIEDIRIFEDDYSAFKINTKNGVPLSKRKGWNALKAEIHKTKETCILLVYDISRLGRNTPDGVTICELLGGYGNKRKIEYIRFYDGTVWDKSISENDINTEFVKACGYSQALAKQKQDKNITSLRRGIMPRTIKAPHGLQATEKGLEETDTMPYIYRAFEMKAEGTLGKDISKYLISHGIPVSEGNLAFMVFQKTQYIGEYTHPKTGDIFDKLIFTSGKTAIPRHLWDKVQSRIGKKVGGYGERQQGDIIAGLLRWEEDKTKSFSLDIKTKPNGKQHKYYKSNSFGGINIGERKIIEKFISGVVPKIQDILFHLSNPDIYNERTIMKDWKILKDCKTLKTQTYIDNYKLLFTKIDSEWVKKNEKNLETELNRILALLDREDFYTEADMYLFKEKLVESFINENDDAYNILISKRMAETKIKSLLMTQSHTLEKEKIEREIKTDRKKQLENKKQELETEKKKLTKNAILGGFTKEETNEIVEDTEKEIQSIESQIEELGESTDMEQFIERLPEVLNKTFELASKVLSNADIETIKKDIEQLLEICTFELTINAKKELKIKLFEGLEVGKLGMVDDIGFEPMTLCV